MWPDPLSWHGPGLVAGRGGLGRAFRRGRGAVTAPGRGGLVTAASRGGRVATARGFQIGLHLVQDRLGLRDSLGDDFVDELDLRHLILWRADGRGINHNPELPRQRRQDLEPAFLETGAIYAMNVAAFRRSCSRFCPPARPVVVEHVGPEIDTPKDLALCRSIAAQKAE